MLTMDAPFTTAYVPCPNTRPTLYLQGTVATLTLAAGSAMGCSIVPPKAQVNLIGIGIGCVGSCNMSMLGGNKG